MTTVAIADDFATFEKRKFVEMILGRGKERFDEANVQKFDLEQLKLLLPIIDAAPAESAGAQSFDVEIWRIFLPLIHAVGKAFADDRENQIKREQRVYIESLEKNHTGEVKKQIDDVRSAPTRERKETKQSVLQVGGQDEGMQSASDEHQEYATTQDRNNSPKKTISEQADKSAEINSLKLIVKQKNHVIRMLEGQLAEKDNLETTCRGQRIAILSMERKLTGNDGKDNIIQSLEMQFEKNSALLNETCEEQTRLQADLDTSKIRAEDLKRGKNEIKTKYRHSQQSLVMAENHIGYLEQAIGNLKVRLSQKHSDSVYQKPPTAKSQPRTTRSSKAGTKHESRRSHSSRSSIFGRPQNSFFS